MAKVLSFQLPLELVAAYAQPGIAHAQKTTIVMISGMSKYRLMHHDAKKRYEQEARTELVLQTFQNTFRRFKKLSVSTSGAAHGSVIKI